jgi:hypothetical protein
MERRLGRIVTGLAAVAAAVASGATGYVIGTGQGDPRHTRVTVAACGLAPSPEPLDLPLRRLLEKPGAPGLSLGPILHPGLDAPLRVRFQPLQEGAAPQARHMGDELVLDLDRTRPPAEIRLACRHGAIGRVEYRTGPLRLVLEVAPDPSAPSEAG